MPVTCGSVGDIIAISLLVKDMIIALDDTCGSLAESQELTRDLNILDKVLLEVSLLARQYATTLEVETLFHTTSATVDNCSRSIKSFAEKVNKYKEAFSNNNGTPSHAMNMTRTARKMQWALVEKDRVKKFRADILGHTSALNMLLATINV